MPSCVISGCKNYNRKTKGTSVSYFRFPNHQHVLDLWVAACKSRKEINLRCGMINFLYQNIYTYIFLLSNRSESLYTSKLLLPMVTWTWVSFRQLANYVHDFLCLSLLRVVLLNLAPRAWKANLYTCFMIYYYLSLRLKQLY